MNTFSGEYWIDPNGESTVDAFMAICNFSTEADTCIDPKRKKFTNEDQEKDYNQLWFFGEVHPEYDEVSTSHKDTSKAHHSKMLIVTNFHNHFMTHNFLVTISHHASH